jgi:hypothetical protein
MHQTTVRFGPDLWVLLEHAAKDAGVSIAQYIRDAALARMAYTAGRGGDPEIDAVLSAVKGQASVEPSRGARAVAASADERDSSTAVWAQARHARQRAQAARETAEDLRAASHERGWHRNA